jgi:hypothetical protein
MGMYDYFKCDVSCPVCGNYMEGLFQTKDLGCLLDTYQPGDRVPKKYGRIKVYHTHDHYYENVRMEGGAFMATSIGVWVEIDIPIFEHIIVMDQNWWTKKWSHVDYNMISFIPDGDTVESTVKRLQARKQRIRRDILNKVIDENNMDVYIDI